MMEFHVHVQEPGKPLWGYTVGVEHPTELPWSAIENDFCDDEGYPLPAGTTVTIEIIR